MTLKSTITWLVELAIGTPEERMRRKEENKHFQQLKREAYNKAYIQGELEKVRVEGLEKGGYYEAKRRNRILKRGKSEREPQGMPPMYNPLFMKASKREEPQEPPQMFTFIKPPSMANIMRRI